MDLGCEFQMLIEFIIEIATFYIIYNHLVTHYRCLQCTSSIDAATISAILDKLFRELEATDATQIQPLEDFIQK